ncbi:hypothetical protein KSF78_0001016 [Schistosoma japonicum]|nr:hypothetical protein KSF78_0001016 [Schistosoma japonicum]KAH8852002.1 hypothetical protein KSF78_0001016 [Schistosoma japonicum]
MAWSLGDICISLRSNSIYDLFVIEEIDSENSVYVIRSSDYTTSCSSNDMLHVTMENIKLLYANDKIMSTLESLASSYFVTKLSCLVNMQLSTTTIVGNTENKKTVRSWNNGDLCICAWSEDEAYYYATILTADCENDIFTVSFCYYENVEHKSFKDLHDINSGFAAYVKDTMNKSVALSLKKNTDGHCELGEDCNNSLEINRSSVHDGKIKELNEITSYLHKISLCPLIPSKKKESQSEMFSQPGFNNFSIESTSKFTKQNISSTRLSFNAPNIQQSIDELQLHPLLLSWFICGYQTGFYEVSRLVIYLFYFLRNEISVSQTSRISIFNVYQICSVHYNFRVNFVDG